MNENQYKLILVSCLKNAVCTKNRNENFEGITEQYKKIENTLFSLEDNCKINLQDDIIQSLMDLKKIFDIKRVPRNEQINRFDEITEHIRGNKELHKIITDEISQMLQ